MTRLRAAALVAFAALAGLFEGPAEIACAVAIAAIALDGGLGGWRPGSIEAGIALWLAAGVPGAIDREAAGTQGLLHPLLALGFVAGARGFARAEQRTLSAAAFAFVLGCSLNGAYGYVQVFVADPPFEALIAGRARSAHLADPEATERLRMATGLFYNRLKLAHVGVLGLGLAGLIAASGAGTRARQLAAAACAIIAGAIFLTYRRAAPIALLGAGALLAVVLARRRAAAAVMITAAAMAALFFLTGYGRERLQSSGGDLSERARIYQAAWAVFAESPLAGVGHGDYPAAVGRHAPEMSSHLRTSPHNLALHVLVETGIAGFAGFAVATGVALVRVVRRVRHDRRSSGPAVLRDRFALLGLLSILALGALHSVLYHVPVALLFWTLLGIAAAEECSA